jgi:hypothetical protein
LALTEVSGKSREEIELDAKNFCGKGGEEDSRQEV